MTTPGLEIEHVSVSFDGSPVLVDVSLRVDRGAIVAVLGPSGSGKSTLLRVVAGLVGPSSGLVRVDGTDMTGIPTHRRGVGLVFQSNQLFPHLDVAGNVGYGLRIARTPTAQRHARVEELLALVGMTGHAHRDVTTLSGGEAARVALARSLATSRASTTTCATRSQTTCGESSGLRARRLSSSRMTRSRPSALPTRWCGSPIYRRVCNDRTLVRHRYRNDRRDSAAAHGGVA
jgi:thiamine transport system ATP-binding protein